MWIFIYLLLPSLAICCEDYWAEYNGYCYRRFSLSVWKDLDDADYFCRTYGGNLVSITSDEERDFILSMTQTGKPDLLGLQTLIGAYRSSIYSPWKWRDGTPFNENHRFVNGGGEENGLCAVMVSDKMVNWTMKNVEAPSEFYLSGLTGVFVSADCPRNFPNKMICKKKDTTNSRTERICGSTWTTLSSNCYKRFSMPSLTIKETENYCKSHGGHLVSVTTEEEKKLVIEMTQMKYFKNWEEQTVIGCYRESNRHPWKWYDGTPFNQTDWFYPDMIHDENCCQLFVDECRDPSLPNVQMYYHEIREKFCTARCNFRAFEFVCEKKGCDLSVSTFSGGRCACNEGLIDITETSLLEAKNYAKGEKCIPNQCHIKKDTSVLFMIDSSESITKAHWPKMLNFIKSAANRIPTKFRVGFLKFSTKVSKGKWISPGWTASDFHEAIPSKYDGGDTNIPEALKKAMDMLKNDKNDDKIVVLITDGLPFSDEYITEDEAQKATVKTAKTLQKQDIRFIVMGFGPKIPEAAKKIKEWVKNPDHDLYLKQTPVRLLNDKDMDALVNTVCN